MLTIENKYCSDLGKNVWTVKRKDDGPIYGDESAIVGLNFDSIEAAFQAYNELVKKQGEETRILGVL